MVHIVNCRLWQSESLTSLHERHKMVQLFSMSKVEVDMNRWHEDFSDEPGPEERMPIGWEDKPLICEVCGCYLDVSGCETGMYEYMTLDLDPGTHICAECLERRTMCYIPDDPSLFDVYTPVHFT
jgi:hypothetical protein